VFPLIAKNGGVSCARATPRRASISAGSAGLQPVGVLAELMNDDGTVMHGPELAASPSATSLWRQHCRTDRLPAGARQADRAGRRISGRVRDRHAHRLRLSHAVRPGLSHGVWHGHIGDGKNVLTRLHRANLITPVRRRQGIHNTLAVLPPRSAASWSCCATARRACRSSPSEIGRDASGEARSRQWRRSDWARKSQGSRRQLDPASESRPMTYVGLSGFGIEIVGMEPVEA